MAKVLSSISGNLISAASAGYAPTNSGDVSAIASAYQVVSATGAQLYAGTAHVTSINGDPISASRAGNAANASMATSAYYDGTGRLISALPDAATVSAIASAYADDKLDKTAEVVTATAGDGTYVTSINGMEISGQGGGGAQVVTATGSASATSLFGFSVVTSYLVSSINGSAILPYGYSTLSGNSANWNSTHITVSSNSAKWTSTNSAVSANSAKWTSTNSAVSANSAKWTSTNSAVSANSAKWNSVYNTVSSNSASWSGSTGGSVTSPSGTIFVEGSQIEGTNSAVLTASAGDGFSSELTPVRNYIESNWYRLYDGILPASGATLTMHTGPMWGANVYFSGKKLDGTLVTDSVGTSGYNGATSLTVNLGEIAREISAYSTTYVNIEDKMTAEKVGGIQVTGVGELAWKSAVDNVTNTVSSNSATWGQGGVDSATVSAIASSYAESAASSKLDTSAQVVTSTASAYDMDGYAWTTEINGLEISAAKAYTTVYANTAETAYSADFASSSDKAIYDANGRFLSSFVDSATVSSYVDSAVSSKADSSALSSYALSADVSGTVDLVSTQSANWGGSALALSAGPGVKLEKVGNTLVAGLDETVLWESSNPTANNYTITLSESIYNFRKLAIYGGGYRDGAAFVRNIRTLEVPSSASPMVASVYTIDGWNPGGNFALCNGTNINLSGTSGYVGDSWYFGMTTGATPSFVAMRRLNDRSDIRPYKIVGIGRTAGV